MTYILQPTNENHNMNALVRFKGSKRDALTKAGNIAHEMQGVLTGCTIACRVQTQAQFNAGDLNGIIAHANGVFISEATSRKVTP